MVHAIARQESQFDKAAVSHAGARGLMQVMPGTARSMGVRDPRALLGNRPLALFDAPTALDVALENGARIQPGDSGGAIFDGGKVAGIMSAGLFEDPENPTEEEMTSNAAVFCPSRRNGLTLFTR